MKNKDLVRAIDMEGPRLRWLHMNGKELTTDRFWSWVGTPEQFQNLQQNYGWDGLRSIPDNRT